MKQTFTIEIEVPDIYDAQFTEKEIELALLFDRRKFLGIENAEKFKFKAIAETRNALKTNDLPKTQIAIHHTENDGYHTVKQPLKMQGIAWDRQAIGDEEDNVFSDIWEDRLER